MFKQIAQNKMKWTLMVLLIVILSGLMTSCMQEVQNEKPNFVFIILDDMEPHMFNSLPEGKGKNLTPNIDRLAKEGTFLMNQYCASPVCTPSRFNSLTGVYGSRAQNKDLTNTIEKFGQTVVQWNTDIIESDENTLPKILQKNGYETAFVGKNHVMKVKGWKWLPFDTDVTKPEVKQDLANNKKLVQEGFHKMGWDYVESVFYRNPEMLGPEVLSVHNQDWVTKGALDFIETKNDDKPFFLYFATTIPHWPHEPKRAWNANPLATADGFLEDTIKVQPARETIPQRLKEAGLEGTGKESLLWLDDAIGALLNKLEKEGDLDNTYIFFFNDHGQDAKGTLYQGGILNPSIIWKTGGLKSGSKNYTKVSNVDFTPTILDLAGVDYSGYKFDGKSFSSVLDGDSTEIHESMFFEMGYTRAIIKGKYKYLALRHPQFALDWSLEKKKAMVDSINVARLARNQDLANPDGDPTLPFSHLTLLPGGNNAELVSYGKLPGYYDLDQLYNLEADPGELNNLAKDPANKELLEEMKLELKKYLDDLPGGFPL
jgi:arylsulfatase A-like enzyme